MINYVAYDETTGAILRSGTAQDELHALMEKGVVVLNTDVSITPTTHYMRDRVFVAYPAKPSPHHEFDFVNFEWRIDSSVAESLARYKRDQLLAESDWTDTVSAQRRMTESELSTWDTYRQALRDVTKQQGFPTNIVWPITIDL